jgi:hypothetical protein
MRRTWKSALAGAIVLALVALAGVALASPVQQFSFLVRNVKPDGRFTVDYNARLFDTTGGVPPELKSNYLRLPAGSAFRKEFKSKRYYCNGTRLLETMGANPQPHVHFPDQVAKLGSLIKILKGRFANDRGGLANIENCQRARVGFGTVQVDVRPIIQGLIPVKIFLFFNKGNAKGAVGAFTIVAIPDDRYAIVRNNTLALNARVSFVSNFFNDPSADGKYGLKLVLPTGRVNGIAISISEVHVTTYGLTLKKVSCLKHSHGRCTKKKTTNVFWLTKPKCPPSGQLSFEAFFGYDLPQPNITQTVQLACPRFSA